jgi:hypothetical protein
MRRQARNGFAAACLSLLGLAATLAGGGPAASADATCVNEALREAQHSTFLPECRAYEMVSPPRKNGGSVMASSARTVSAEAGGAVAYSSLAGFGDVEGTGVATDYLAQRSLAADPGDNGWSTHAISPPASRPLPVRLSSDGFEPLYASYAADLSSAVLQSWAPLTADPWTEDVPNLYSRTGLRSGAAARYSLLSPCPLCQDTSTPLAPYSRTFSSGFPKVVGVSADGTHVLFESVVKLTADASEGLADGKVNLYESDHGLLRLAAILPGEVPAESAIAGQGDDAGKPTRQYTPHVISSDGSRVFFTANPTGCHLSVGSFASCGDLYLRDRGPQTPITDHLNEAERVPPDPRGHQKAIYWDAAADGSRAFFFSDEELTDMPGGGLYAWSDYQSSEVQMLRIEAGDGTYVLSFEGETATLPYDADAAAIEAALNALPAISTGGGSVSVSASGSASFSIAFKGALAERSVPQIQLDATRLATAVGKTLKCASGATLGELSYRWLRNGTPIPGADAPNYTTVVEDAGGVVQCQTTAIIAASGAGSTQVGNTTLASLPNIVAPFPAEAPPKVTEAPEAPLPANPEAGTAETCQTGAWTGSPSFGYQWYVNGVAVPGATGSTYTVQAADVPSAIQCAVAATNSGGTTVVLSGDQTTMGGIGELPFPTATVGSLFSSSETVHGGHLTLIAGNVSAVFGASDDGHSVYFSSPQQLVPGQPPIAGPANGIFLWADGPGAPLGGELRFLGSGNVDGNQVSGSPISSGERYSRVSPDGRFFLFNATDGAGLLSVRGGSDYDHGTCLESGVVGCRELYLYDAATDTLACASCRPDGSPPVAAASDWAAQVQGGSRSPVRQDRALVEGPDGNARVFFSTADPLVPADTNGKSDAYEYDAGTGEVHLLSSGTSTEDSWFMDASADGSEAFFVTSQRLVGWDTDNAFDLYVARVGGGFPEPRPVAEACGGEVCRAAPSTVPAVPGAASQSLVGPGNPQPIRRGCPKGRHAVTSAGRTRCLKPRRHHRSHHRRAGSKRGGSK